MRLYGLPPIVFRDSRFLILGSFPSVASLEEGMYYGHRRNHFWPLLSRILGLPVPVRVEEKRALLEEGNLALWDLVASCERAGSLDQNILEPELNDIAGFLGAYPAIERILLNGSLAASLLYRKLIQRKGPLPALGSMYTWEGPRGKPMEIFRLPSTSPVPTRRYRRLEDKLPLWKAALNVGGGQERG
jgi:TDG/mug DNA glycosylase family protein